VKKETKVKPGTLVKIRAGLEDDPKYQRNPWNDDARYFLRDPETLGMLPDTWAVPGEPCIVVDQDLIGVVILTPRGKIGWIGKEKVEVVK